MRCALDAHTASRRGARPSLAHAHPSRAIDRDAIDRAPPPSSTSSPSASRDDDATTDRSSLDDEDIETIFSSRLRHRLRLRTVASSVAPLRPTSASPTSDNALEVEALRPIDRARVADRPDARRSLSIASRGFFSSRARRTIVSPSVCSSDDARSTRAFAVNQINHINHHHRPRARGDEDEDDRPVRCRPRPSLAFDFGTCPTPTLV